MSKQTKVEIFHFSLDAGGPDDAQVTVKVMSVAEDKFVISNVETNEPYRNTPTKDVQEMISRVGIGKEISIPEIMEIIAENAWNCTVDGVDIALVYPQTIDGNSLLLEFSGVTNAAVLLEWTPDIVGGVIAKFVIYENGVLYANIADPTDVSFLVDELTTATTYEYHIVALNAFGNVLATSNTVEVETL